MQQLRNIMTTNVLTVNESQSVQEAAALMSEYNIGSIPVVNNSGQMVGIITDRDITLRSTAQGENAQTPVSQVMTAQQIVQGTPDMDVQQAAQLMAQQQIRPKIDTHIKNTKSCITAMIFRSVEIPYHTGNIWF